MYFVYILINNSNTKTYTGHTNNLENRLKQHNDGKVKFSRIYRPWNILYSEELETEEKAIVREKYFKSAAGRRWIKKNLFK